ncbi:hypothetical protein [Pseudomonas alkylphenolica]|uniref:hypothetical protein n=1 Tax=Pseudomonas alkylphenolica TaxID=237609 RepID=UPI00056EBB76|nr:hypothetical protein [Pseudomonas alkylphenolica]
MKKAFVMLGLLGALSQVVHAESLNRSPLETEMGAQVYICGLKSQLAQATKGKKQDGLTAEARECSRSSKESAKTRIKGEIDKYPEGDAMRDRLKALYSAYLTYMDAAMWGKDLNESSEALAFKMKANEYKAELQLR